MIRIQMRWGERSRKGRRVWGEGARFFQLLISLAQRKCAPLTQSAPRCISNGNAAQPHQWDAVSSLSLFSLPFPPAL